jgi:DNA-binding winged helix-turn-helix (wHTH) protein
VSTEPHRFFPPFRLDPLNAQLWRSDEQVSLRRKTFDVLRYLVDHPGQLVTKAALLDAVWADVTLSDSMPAICVAELRKVLADEARIPRFIETVHAAGTDLSRTSRPLRPQRQHANCHTCLRAPSR